MKTASIIETTLSDNSKVYDIEIVEPFDIDDSAPIRIVEFECLDKKHAIRAAKQINKIIEECCV